MALKRIEIEDVSDCATCTERDRGLLEELASVKMGSLGNAYCVECGREFLVLVPVADLGGQFK